MKKTKLFKSLLVAAGLCVGASAWAENLIFTEDFSDDSYNVSWGGTSAGGITPSITDGALKVANGSQSGDRSAYIAFGDNSYTGCCHLTFDMSMTKSGWSGKNNNFYVLPSETKDRYPSTTNAALIVNQDYNGAITVAGESIGSFDGTLLTYDLLLNTTTGNAKVVVKKGTTEIKTITYTTTATGINTLHLNFNKNNGAFAIDNISLYSLIAPSFTLSSTEETVSVNGTATVDVSNIIGNISVSSDNESAATVSYDNGVVTINGISSGVANITVTSTNDGLDVSKTIVATIGEVATTNVTVNYLCGEEAIAEPLIISDVTVGSTLTSSEVVYESVIYGTNVRYINPVLDQALPYVVVENGTINISYTSQAAVTNVKKIVKVGDVELSNIDVAQEGKYVGDVISFSYPLYVNYNGTLYSKGANSNQYNQSFTLTGTNQECILSYSATSIKDVVYFSEAEFIEGATATSSGSNMTVRSSNQACGFASEDLTLATLPAGIYKATFVCYSNSSAGSTLHFSFGDKAYDTKVSGASNWSSFTSTFFFDSNSDVKWLTSGDSKNGLDFIYIQKTGDYFETMTICGDFFEGGWAIDNGIAMTRDADNPFIWTGVYKDYVVTSEDWDIAYKAFADGTTTGYQLGADDDPDNNQTFGFNFDGAGEGTYDLTFTVNTQTHRVSMLPTKQVDYVLVGTYSEDTNPGFFGTSWDVNSTSNVLTANGDGTYSKTFYNVALEAGTIKYKVTEGHSWDKDWGFADKPNGNAEYNVNVAGNYDITFTFNPLANLSNGYHLTCELTAAPSTVTKTITAAGYATYCSPYALDFTNVEGLTAYRAVLSGNKISFESVDQVPAGEGVLLKGSAVEYTIPVIASATAIENVFEGVLEDTKVAAGIYVLMNPKDGPGVGFYQTTKEFTVGANTAYIPALDPDPDGTARTFIAIDGEATGIEGVAAEKNFNGEIYNLQGQRVMKAQKGLYIINGKKVLVK